MIDEALHFDVKDANKKVYEIEYDVTYATKWQVLAHDKDEALDIWSDQHKINMSTEDSRDIVCSYSKDYTEIGGCKEIATIKYNKEDDEVYVDES